MAPVVARLLIYGQDHTSSIQSREYIAPMAQVSAMLQWDSLSSIGCLSLLEAYYISI